MALGRKRRSSNSNPVDQLPITMMAFAKRLQLADGSREMQGLVEMIGIAASEDPAQTARDFGRSDDAREVATRDPSAEESAASRFLAFVSAYAGDELDEDQALIAMQYAGMLATRFPTFMQTA